MRDISPSGRHTNLGGLHMSRRINRYIHYKILPYSPVNQTSAKESMSLVS